VGQVRGGQKEWHLLEQLRKSRKEGEDDVERLATLTASLEGQKNLPVVMGEQGYK
jgi:hypothetical protein